MMEAGPELNALVAEKVMGLKNVGMRNHVQGEDLFGEDQDGDTVWVPAYSTDIAAAWLVVDKMRQNGRVYLQGRLNSWTFRCSPDGIELFEADAPTAPLAICRAALAAVGVEAG